MYISAIIKSMGPVKFIISIIFLLLPILELLDGSLVTSDLVASMMLMMVISDLYHSHLRSIFSNDFHVHGFNASRAVYTAAQFSTSQIKESRFIGKLPASSYFFRTKRAFIFQQFRFPSDYSINRGPGTDPQFTTLNLERKWKIQMIMGLVYMFLLGLSQLIHFYGWVESIVIPAVMIVWVTALVMDIRRHKTHWRKSFRLIYANLAIVVFVGTVLHLS